MRADSFAYPTLRQTHNRKGLSVGCPITGIDMVRLWNARVAGSILLAALPTCTLGRHLLLDKILSDDPPPGQSDASCAHLVRVGLDEGVDSSGKPLIEPEVHHLISAMRKTWWQCASAVANALAKYGSEVEDAFQMEQRSITKHLNEIKSALQKGKPVQSISPAFEWAQSGDWVYINAKMSHKIDAPATLNVVSEGVEMEKRSLKFAASKDHKRFLLDLNLHDDIDPDPSTISFGSVGRVSFTLKKAKGGVKWPKLLDNEQKKPVNMHVWWAKQEEYSDELDDLEEAAAEARGKPAKAAAGAGASTGTASATGGKGATTGGGGDAVDDGRSTDAGVDSDKKPLSADARLAKARKDASTALAREKKTRMEELEKEKRAVTKTIDADAVSKKKQAEEALKGRKAMVDEDFEELLQKKYAEIEASHAQQPVGEL